MKSIATHKLLLSVCLFWVPIALMAQSETEYFNKAARQYVNEDIPGTSQLLAEGLEKYPQDPKLNALWEKLQKDQEDQEKKDQQSQEQQDQEQDESQEQDQQEQDSQEQESGEGEEQTEEDGADESDEMERTIGVNNQTIMNRQKSPTTWKVT